MSQNPLPSQYPLRSLRDKSPAVQRERTSSVTSSATKELRPQVHTPPPISTLGDRALQPRSKSKRAARQQGDPFSMGGSSNGGKAIGTLWCKSMFHSGWCQDTNPENRNLLKMRDL